ncbi:hypothetical protein PTTG_08414 [Puccinia triticina 1-1 BBBD Race 1]|uniref:Uncharacterized protein n=1 Tax=Puccinia triticina (isolate 1-1 / race 1 (BBBD)) TaxID=630390 RepID=A0A180H3D2_PUCT1|nr:hypothetical protein PTTG_08414 [Puccinia triticina 1-1 BBBD Race 1]
MAAPSPLLLGLSWIQQACGKQITIELPANGAVLRPGQQANIILKLTSAAPQALEAALSHLVLKTLYTSDLHIDPRNYSYRLSLILPHKPSLSLC